MLTATLAPDAAVPARDRLLDETSATQRLAELLGVEPVSGGRLRAKYRIGESLRIVQRVSDGLTTYVASARTFPGTTSRIAFDRALRNVGGRPHVEPPVIHDSEWATVWWVFPADRRMRCLESLLRPDPARSARLGLGEWRTSEVVEYAAERSVTLCASADDGRVCGYVKAYAPGTVDPARLARRYDIVAAGVRRRRDLAEHFATPAALGCDETALALEPMPGTTWAASGHDGLPLLLTRLGRAIAGMHDLPLGTELRAMSRFGRLRPQRVVHSAQLVARARPDLAAICGRLASAFAGGPTFGATVLLHGDCHPKNALLDGDRVALVDLDQAGLGDAAADIGSLLARIRHGVLLGEYDDHIAEALCAAFVAGYSAVRPLPPPASMRWHTAAALVAERALRAVNRVQPAALTTLPALLSLAETELTVR